MSNIGEYQSSGALVEKLDWSDSLFITTGGLPGKTIHRAYPTLNDCAATVSQSAGAEAYWVSAGPTLTGTITGAPNAAAERESAAQAERTRILAVLEDMKPPHRPRTHGDWARAWKESGELAMWEKVVAAIKGAA